MGFEISYFTYLCSFVHARSSPSCKPTHLHFLILSSFSTGSCLVLSQRVLSFSTKLFGPVPESVVLHWKLFGPVPESVVVLLHWKLFGPVPESVVVLLHWKLFGPVPESLQLYSAQASIDESLYHFQREITCFLFLKF